ncbi:helix-turn-helix domain-containing protein [Novosphingobium sp. 1949]|uniref:Helix-turn-helix domain-containing protein n=1 Tax=Novosphingobium organovorum TaxID=2930092 RepID=A0ABT0BFS3_9SPHN|nr:helix-turn-helix domain-containing protein [Novosphingobium organovorum]MCJ2183879.1 helix-turn-helix domain-containing protein [Novosphingobium organovorum]
MSAIPDKDARCQAIAALIATGKGVVESCREIGISEKTFQRWRKARQEQGAPQ